MTRCLRCLAQVPVTLYRKFVPTPLVPWCVEELGCAAGVMVTASHNPKEDNGTATCKIIDPCINDCLH